MKRKVLSTFIGKIWGAYLADMHLIVNLINEFVYLATTAVLNSKISEIKAK